MSPVPFAHLGHALPLLPFFAPPLILTLGIVLLTLHDRLRRRRNGEGDDESPDSEPQRPERESSSTRLEPRADAQG